MAKDLVVTMFTGCKVPSENWIKYAKENLLEDMKEECDYLDISKDSDIEEYLFQVLGIDGLEKKLKVKIVEAISDEKGSIDREYYIVCGRKFTVFAGKGHKNRKLKIPTEDQVSTYHNAIEKLFGKSNDEGKQDIWCVSSFDC